MKKNNIIIVILIILLIYNIVSIKNILSEDNNTIDYNLEETNIKKLIDGKWKNDDRIFFFDTEKNKISFEDSDYYCLGNCDYTVVIQNNDNYKILINNFDTNGDIKFNEIVVTVQKDKTNTITIGKQEFNKVVNESNNDNFTWFSVFFIVLIVLIFVSSSCIILG